MKRSEVILKLVTGPIPHFNQMVKLGRALAKYIVSEFGTKYFLDKISDPLWFQAFSAIMGIEHWTSGSTTVTLMALKQGIQDFEKDLGLFIAGGKGKEGVNTPNEIKEKIKKYGLKDLDYNYLVKISRLTAKIDNAAIQDTKGSIYFHTILFDEEGNWAVIQQKMNPEKSIARRYQWFNVPEEKFLNNPHKAIFGIKKEVIINLASKFSKETRETILDLIIDSLPSKLKKEIELLRYNPKAKELLRKNPDLVLPKRIDQKILEELKKEEPETFEELLLKRGVGPSTIRGLALVSHLIYSSRLDLKDPAFYYHAFGSKMGIPYRIKKKEMVEVANLLETFAEKLDKKDREKVLKRLKNFVDNLYKE